MNEVKIPALPADVAEVLERLQTSRVSNERIVELAISGGISPSANAVHSYAKASPANFDKLLAAIVLGEWTVEHTKRERVTLALLNRGLGIWYDDLLDEIEQIYSEVNA